MEIWKDVINYEGLYLVSNTGKIKRNNKILKIYNNGNNYMSVCLSKNGNVKKFYIHRIVAQSFLENKENKKEVNHIDGNRQNNNLKNLEWVTRSQNHYHRYKVLKQRGVNYGKTGAKNWKSKPVFKFDFKGNFICEYPGVMEASRQTGIGESNIRCCIYNKQKTAGGYIWRYKK